MCPVTFSVTIFTLFWKYHLTCIGQLCLFLQCNPCQNEMWYSSWRFLKQQVDCMQCKTSEANAFQFERPLWYMQKLLAVQCSAESWMPFNMKDPFGRTGWLPAHHQRGLSKWMPFSSAHVCECPIELLPASCIPSGMPAQLAVQKSHSCFTRRSKLYNLKAYASDVMIFE